MLLQQQQPPPPPTGPPASPLTPSHLKFPVIGIGGSAGGLKSVIRFFEQMPANEGMAFVVILHLSPTHKSSAAEILQRVTGMPVRQVNETMPVQANHVYVIPPGVELTMSDGHLCVTPSERVAGRNIAIDVFFRTMAQVHGGRAVCIVMSGTGSDGAVGLTSVKEHGGISMAETPEDAEHDGMPRAAIATGAVDFVLPAAGMPERLVEIWRSAQNIQLPLRGTSEPSSSDPAGPMPPEEAETALQDVMSFLRAYTRHDFRHYKRATVLRRIERRLQVNRLTDLSAYRNYLREHPAEAPLLLQDMLISVTNFFRDREAFDALERGALRRIIEAKQPGEQVRVWVAGCATGEEAYSVSMLLREQIELLSKPLEIQVFATDIDERAIATARKGIYPQGISVDVTASRLSQFFLKDEGQFRVAPRVREPVLFALHNLLRDPPFSRLDLVCCRNLLIYLDRAAQSHVLEMFRIALGSSGYLFMGTSESTDAVGNLFASVDKKNRIFRVNPGFPPGRLLPLTSEPALAAEYGALPSAPLNAYRRASDAPVTAEMHQRAIEQFSPPSVLINSEHDVLHLSNGVGRFLERPGGEPSNNLLNNVRSDVRIELRTALFKASQSGRNVETRIVQSQEDGRQIFLNITVRPLPPAEGKPGLILVVFDEVEGTVPLQANDADSSARMLLIGQMEDEIRQLKLHLQDTIEHSETSNEELKASNEELQAINEELRSATEELETSKEELQSMNEELVTVNHELKVKVEERGHINDDLQNLISSSEIATVFVTRGMRVKRYTPQAATLFNLIPTDLGRSLFDITSRLNYAELADDTESAFKHLRTIERQVSSIDGRFYAARILPYRTADDKIEGAILNFFDITDLREAEEQVRAGEERLRRVAATTRDFAIITTNAEGLITSWNRGARRIFGYSEEEMLQQPIAAIFTPEDQAHGIPEREMRTATQKGRAEDERWHLRKDGSRFYCSGVTTPIEEGEGGGFAKIARDMTGTKQQELAQEHRLVKEKRASLNAQAANELKDRFLAVMSHELKQPLNLIQMNAELLIRLPVTAENPSVRRLADAIRRAVGSQSRIINDLLDLSRIRTGKLRLNRVAVNMGELVQTACEAVVANLAGKKLELDMQCDVGVVCSGDRVRVEQIAWNLLSNAAKFTPEGGRIKVRVSSENGFARLTVTDTGCGIAADFLPHVFGMFNQASDDTAATKGGLGIGLALVQELASAHGGRVQARSDGVGRGAEFSVWLPLVGTDGPQRRQTEPVGVDLKGMRVLAVDDYADALAPFAEVLRLEGAIVDTACTGKEALALLKAQRYDLLVSDLGMPEMDGFELIGEVRRMHATRELRCVAMSGFGRRVDARRALEAGFDAHLPKPASIDELKAAIAKI
jgi:two-component system CheB/CheR fusion protein